MAIQIFRRLLVFAILLAYPVAWLYPFQWQPPRVNGAERPSGGELQFATPGIAQASGPLAWVAAAKHAQQFALQLDVRPFSTDQQGPARIFTVSNGTSYRDLMVGQDGTGLVVRLRTPETDLNGTPAIVVPDVFRTDRWTDIGVRVDDRRLQVTVNGVPRVREELRSAPLRVWNFGYGVAFGNEFTGTRPWRGEIRQATVQAGDVAVDYLRPDALYLPLFLWREHTGPTLVPFQDMSFRDTVKNIAGFVPLGALLGLWLGRRRRGRWLALAVVLAVSVFLETAQMFIPHRYPSVNDVIMNLLGGGVGILLSYAAALVRRRRAWRSAPERRSLMIARG